MTAVIDPDRDPAEHPRGEIRDDHQQRAADRREGQDQPGVRPDEHPDDVRHDEPDEPDQPADRDRRRGHERGQAEQDRPLAPDVDAEMGRRFLAEEQPVQRPRPDEDQDRPDRDQRDRPGELAPRGVLEAPEQVGEDLAEGRAGQVHRHRQRRGEERSEGVSGQEQARHRRAARRSGTGGTRRSPTSSAPAKARTWSRPNARSSIRIGMSTAIAAPRAAPDAVPSTYGSASGFRSRPWNVVPGDCQPEPDDHRLEDPRQAQVPDDRLVGRGPGPGEVERRAAGGR